MIVITVGKNALLGIKDKDKYLEDFRAALKLNMVIQLCTPMIIPLRE
jgi:hypothetical protein